jgi:hypothetical protein
MQLTRQEDASLYLHVRDIVLGPHYSEISLEQTLTRVGASNIWNIGYDDGTTDPRYPFTRGSSSGLGRGILCFDHIGDTCVFGSEQTDIVKVYDGATNATGYRVNYITGQIESSDDLTGYLVDYEWYYISVLDAWPREDVPFLPLVSIELQKALPRPLQLGGGDIREGSWNIQIFAKNKVERDDLMDVLYSGLNQRRCSLYNFSKGLPLSGNGFYNTSFVSDLHPQYTSLFFEKVEKRLTGLPSWGFYEQEQVNRYRAEITFTTKAFKN